ncbi:MAG: serine/threonine protein kinase [Ruminococcus sp.]|nr:serine/threonine protein kinase [Ruminococcus sp.]
MSLYELLRNFDCRYLPQIYSVDISDGKTVVTEEFISGKNLLDANLDEKQVINAMMQLCAALDFIHGLRIVHRDIKPSNILLSEDGNIRLIDFEAARFVRDGKDKDTRYLGTDGFAPPEQYGFSQTDPRADIYAAGQTMKTLLGSLSAKRKYAKIIRKCTALDPAERYQNARALADALTNKREKIVSAAVFAATAVAVLIFAAIVPKEAPAENIPDEAGIVAEAEANTAETTSVSATEFTTEATTASETEASATEESTAEIESTSETETDTEAESTSETTITAETVITDENNPTSDRETSNNLRGIRDYSDLPARIDKYNAEILDYCGVSENLPEYDRHKLLLVTYGEDTKILFTDEKALFQEHQKFYMYFDMDRDGITEAIIVEAGSDMQLNVTMIYGVPQDTYSGLRCYWSDFLIDMDVNENYYLQITGYKAIDGNYLAVTVGDGKSFNVTEMYTARDGAIEYLGSGWGETTGELNSGLKIRLADDRINFYDLWRGEMSIIDEYDNEKYPNIKYGEYSKKEPF